MAPDLDLSLFAKETPPAPPGSSDEVIRLTKLFYDKEHRIFLRLQNHPRIARYHGWDLKHGLLFDRYPAGDLFTHLLQNRDTPPPLLLRLRWVREIAEGLAYIHSKGVVWVDVTLSNVLLTERSSIVLCDFAGSCLINIPGEQKLPYEYRDCQVLASHMMQMPRYKQGRLWKGPGSPHPNEDWLLNPHSDRFAFGALMFCLIALRFPHSPFFVVHDLKESVDIFKKHQALEFDTFGDVEEYRALNEIVRKCFYAAYDSTDKLLEDIRVVCDAMPSNAPLLQDKIRDSEVYLPESRSTNRRLFPFGDNEDEFD